MQGLEVRLGGFRTTYSSRPSAQSTRRSYAHARKVRAFSYIVKYLALDLFLRPAPRSRQVLVQLKQAQRGEVSVF